MSIWKNKIWIALIFASLSMQICYSRSEKYIAFSLREATRMAGQGDRSDELLSLGDIRRVLGIVHDEKTGDIILIGKVMEGGAKTHLDDLVVALRAILVHNESPMVSIDPTEDTLRTGLQKVRFKGAVGQTSFGADILGCDVILKEYSLELLESLYEVKSYRSLCMEEIIEKAEAEGVVVNNVRWKSPKDTPASVKGLHGRPLQSEQIQQTRFWFFPDEPSRLAVSEGVFCIMELNLIVKAESLSPKTQNAGSPADSLRDDKPEKAFAARFAENLRRLSEAYPLLKKLKLLYDLVAVAQGIQWMECGVDLSYLLKEYKVAHRETPSDFPLISICGLAERSDGKRSVVMLSGGIDLGTELKWMNDGDVTPLRTIVTHTRPGPNALSWHLPLQGWITPNSKDLVPLDQAGPPLAQEPETVVTSVCHEKVGCSIFTQSCTLGSAGSGQAPGVKIFAGFASTPASPDIDAMEPPRMEFHPYLSGTGVRGGVLVDYPEKYREGRIDETGEVDALGKKVQEAVEKKPDDDIEVEY